MSLCLDILARPARLSIPQEGESSLLYSQHYSDLFSCMESIASLKAFTLTRSTSPLTKMDVTQLSEHVGQRARTGLGRCRFQRECAGTGRGPCLGEGPCTPERAPSIITTQQVVGR